MSHPLFCSDPRCKHNRSVHQREGRHLCVIPECRCEGFEFHEPKKEQVRDLVRQLLEGVLA